MRNPPGLGALYYGALALCGFGLPLFLLARRGSGGIMGIGNSGGDSWPEKVILLALGGAWLLFTFRAVRMAFRRIAFVIDRRAQTIRTRSWWPFPPGHAKALASFNLVAVGEISISGPPRFQHPDEANHRLSGGLQDWKAIENRDWRRFSHADPG